MKLKIFCRCSLFPSWSVYGLISTPVVVLVVLVIVVVSSSSSSRISSKVLPQQAEVAQGAPRRLRSPIFLTFGSTRVVGRQLYAPAAFTPEAESTPR